MMGTLGWIIVAVVGGLVAIVVIGIALTIYDAYKIDKIMSGNTAKWNRNSDPCR